MSKPIKFRAWDKKDRAMCSVYGLLYPEWHKDRKVRDEVAVRLFCAEVNHDLKAGYELDKRGLRK